MGLIIRDQPEQSRSGSKDLPSAGASMLSDETLAREPAKPMVVAGPPLGSLDMTRLEEREIPRLTAARENRLQVAITRSVLSDIREHGKSQTEVEVCGVLVGNVYRDQSGPFLHIEANIRGNNATGKAAQVTFTAETWKHIQDVMEEKYPDDRIVGWYHTHPGFGIFLSDMDLFIHNNFFSEPWQVAFVYDPKSNEQGLFMRRGGQTIREKFLLDDEGEPGKPGDAAIIGNSAQMVAPGTISELSARVQKLERKQRWQSALVWLMLLLLFVWPLAVAILMPNGVRDLPPSVQRLLGTERFGSTPVAAHVMPAAPVVAAAGLNVHSPVMPAVDANRLLVGQLNNLRMQILIYKREHNHTPPEQAKFWSQLTRFTNVAGDTSAIGDPKHKLGPYYESSVKNALTGTDAVGGYEGDANAGWAYDETTGQLRAMKGKGAGEVLE